MTLQLAADESQHDAAQLARLLEVARVARLAVVWLNCDPSAPIPAPGTAASVRKERGVLTPPKMLAAPRLEGDYPYLTV